MSKNIAKYRNLLFRWKRARAIYDNIWRYLTIFDDIWRHRRSSFKPENCRPKVSSSVGTNKLKKKFFQLFQKEQDYRHFKKPVMSKLNIISAYCWLLLQRKSVKKAYSFSVDSKWCTNTIKTLASHISRNQISFESDFFAQKPILKRHFVWK